MKIHSSGEDHLEAILVLEKKIGQVRAMDVVRYLGLSKSSVSGALSLLREGGFVTADQEHNLYLTGKGKKVAEKIYERHSFLKNRFIHIGVAPEVAEQDACRIEHVISEETFEKLKVHLKQQS